MFESNVYEGAAHFAAGAVHVAADGHLDGGQSLYNIVDSFFVAKISEDAMTALSLVFPIQNLVNAVTIGFAIGINARDCVFSRRKAGAQGE